MGRTEMINTTRAILAKAGFDVSSALSIRGICFDIVAKRDRKTLIVKVLSNVDAFSKDNATEMKMLADALECTPLVIGERSSSGILETGIVYSRFDISIISNETLADMILEDEPPYIFAAPGGLYVKLDGSLLRTAREQMGLSLGAMADIVGVSRRTIQMYESGMGAMIDAALRIEESLGLPIIEPIDPFVRRNDRGEKPEPKPPEDSFAVNRLCNLGFAVKPVVRSPFEAISINSRTQMLTGYGSDDEKMIQRAMIASDIARIMDTFSIIIVERKHERDNIDSTAVVSNEELKKMEHPDELTDLVAERGGK